MPAIQKIRIATRQSPLALWQTEAIREQLLIHWPHLTIEFLPLSTSGDQFLKDKLLKVGGKGLFVKELEEALLDKRADLAVHSMKDVPVSFPEGLMLGAICARHSPYDALISPHFSHLESLPIGARIGTSSLRRQSQLLALRPDLNVETLRGNIHTRIEKVDRGECDAIILAAAGLLRMKLDARIRHVFEPHEMLPACGQGALGIECRADDAALHALLLPLNDSLTAECVTAERKVNALLGGNCHTPLAVFCRPIDNHHVILSARVVSSDGSQQMSAEEKGPRKDALLLAERVVLTLLSQGAKTLLDAL